MKEMNCICCHRPLAIPEGAQSLECPACLTVNHVPSQQTVHRPCARCLHLLAFGPGAQLLECPACGQLNERPRP